MDLHSSGLCLCWMCRCPLHQRSCRGTIVFPCGNLIRITQRDCAARWLVCIDVSCWLDSNTYVLGGTSLKALCQSGVWKKTQGAGVRALVSWLPQSCTPSCPLTNSSNVASVLRNGAGDFTIVFSTAFPSSVYSFVANWGIALTRPPNRIDVDLRSRSTDQSR